MDTSNPRPKWWQLYLTFPLLVVLFIADQRLKISTAGHEAVQLGILAAVFGLIYLWLNANSVALSRMDWDQYHGTIKTTRIELYEVEVPNEERTLISDAPCSELKGLLGTEFGTEPLDAARFRNDGALRRLKKGQG